MKKINLKSKPPKKKKGFAEKTYERRTRKVAKTVDKKGIKGAEKKYGDASGHNTFLRKPINTIYRTPSKAQILSSSDEVNVQDRKKYIHRFDKKKKK